MPDRDTSLLDGFGPLPVVSPNTVTEVGERVRRAAIEGMAIYPVGGRTMLNLGMPPTRHGFALDLRRLDHVIDYPARDMTVTVQAGINIAKLQALLATENQRLPVDVPLADKATLGGALATNVSGPRRYGFGMLRDYVIGISVINDEGQETKAGGRVVKNVAGYDLCKLHVGALGTLGVISQVTLKLRPKPEDTALLVFGCGTESVEPLLDLLHRSRTHPVCIDLLNDRAALQIHERVGDILRPAPWNFIVGFEDSRERVRWQIEQIQTELASPAAHGLVCLDACRANPLWQELVEFPSGGDSSVVFKANLTPSATAEFCRQATILSEKLLLQAHAGSGIVLGRIDSSVPLENMRVLHRHLLESAVAAQGNLILLRCPTEWKKDLPVWGNPRADNWLMRAVKDKLDPKGVFNPGRFVAGI